MTQSSSSQKDEKVVTLYTKPPEDATTICLDELGPVSPRTYPPAPGCSQDGHRISRRPWNTGGVLRSEKVWVYGALRVRDGQALTLTHRSRNTEGYLLRLLKAVERENPRGDLYLITDNLS